MKILEIQETEKGVKREAINATKVGIDLDVGLRGAVQAAGFEVNLDVMHLYRAWFGKYTAIQGTTLHNKLKKAGFQNWYRTFQEVFSLVLVRRDLVPRAARQIRDKMGAIIRLAKNDEKIGSDVFYEGNKFPKLFFDIYLKTNYTDPQDSLFKVSNWSIFNRTGERFYHNMLESHFKTLKSQLKKHTTFSRLFPLLKAYSDKRLLRYEAMKEAP